MSNYNILFLGDVVGRPGRTAVQHYLSTLQAIHNPLFTIINGENAAGGVGITPDIADEFFRAGADAITLGNHSFDQREALVFIERQQRLLRPINYPPATPGRGATIIDTATGARVLVVNAMARLFMDPLDDPFAAVDRVVTEAPLGQMVDAILVDFHGEATSEKQAMGRYLDGRVSLVVGTHTDRKSVV